MYTTFINGPEMVIARVVQWVPTILLYISPGTSVALRGTIIVTRGRSVFLAFMIASEIVWLNESPMWRGYNISTCGGRDA
jgi:hypothetical protein